MVDHCGETSPVFACRKLSIRPDVTAVNGSAASSAIDWVLDHAGVRVHGTTQEIPLHVFEARERPALIALPPAPFDLVEWKQAKLHPTATSCSGGATTRRRTRSSASGSGYARRRASSRSFTITSSSRPTAGPLRPGQRVTNPAHLPPKKLRYMMQTLSGILETLELRNRGAIESKLSYVEFLAQLVEDEVERRPSTS